MSPLQLVAEPLTFEAWAPYGHVIQGSSNPASMPSHVITNTIVPEQAYKFNRISPIKDTYPEDSNHPVPVTAINVIRAPPTAVKFGGTWDVRMMERHACTTQAFVPMRSTGGDWDNFLQEKGLGNSVEGGMLAIGCLNGLDDKPDLSTLKAFLVAPSQGISYNAGTWHHSIVSLTVADYAAIDTQITTNSGLKIDCEIHRKGADEEPYAVVQLPAINPA